MWRIRPPHSTIHFFSALLSKDYPAETEAPSNLEIQTLHMRNAPVLPVATLDLVVARSRLDENGPTFHRRWRTKAEPKDERSEWLFPLEQQYYAESTYFGRRIIYKRLRETSSTHGQGCIATPGGQWTSSYDHAFSIRIVW